MRKFSLALLGAAAIVVLGAESASAQQFNICTKVGGIATRNFQATIMSSVGNSFSMVVIDTASVNAIGLGAMNINTNFLAPFTLSWNITADGVTEHFDCRLFFPQLSGLGNILTVTNTGNTRQQLSPCLIKTSPC
jgi:hypothetical protein